MFKKHLWASLLFFVCFIAVSVAVVYFPSKKTKQKYFQLLEGGINKTKNKNRVTKQKRENVSKQILYLHEGKRMQSRLSCYRSELVLDQSSKKNDLKEFFENVTCSMQEKLLNESQSDCQVIRDIVAQHAVYSYRLNQLEAKDVLLARNLYASHEWPANMQHIKCLFSGQASHVKFSLFNAPLFEAKNLKANLSEWSHR